MSSAPVANLREHEATHRYREEVLAELRETVSWYDEQRHGLGERFFQAVEATLSRIEENPEQFPMIYRDLRRALLAVVIILGFPSQALQEFDLPDTSPMKADLASDWLFGGDLPEDPPPCPEPMPSRP